ncbi:hypothetical protein D9756_003051 [Leucocoprinus leucothites]|uniref:Uncharacterized protein n=1 Tax=Leucocoprinus leucothites TaxID=201217 RepID=A0A8H5LJC8_9AGAR|nr:hypothetical protein D9756_003051 [Leucoagaricus leucothites]
MKKHSATRSIPPPIDLSVSGSNLRRTVTPGSSDKDRTMGGHPYSRYIIELEDETSPVPTFTPSTINFSPSLTPGPTSSVQGASATSPSTTSLSTSAQDHTRLVPNRRRRSYSESAYSPNSSSPTQRSVSGPVYNGVSSPSKGVEGLNSAGPSNHTRSLRTVPSFHFGLGSKSRGCPSTDDVPHHQRPSTGGKRNKLWSSITHFPLSAGFSGSWDFGHGGDHNDNSTPRKKTRRPGTSPSTPSSWMSFTDQLAASNALSRVGSLKKRQRPSTASSTAPSPCPSPLRSSKLEWQWQWPGKRLSRSKAPSSPSISLAPVQITTPSTSTISTHSSPSPLSASSSTSSASLAFPSPISQPATPKKATSQILRTPSSAKKGFQDSNSLAVFPSPNLRNRSTPNLQAPDLSIEDLGKINAFYAPPPPAIAVQALSDAPRRRAASSGPKSKPRLSPPPEMPPIPVSKRMPKPLPLPNQTSVSVTTRRASKGHGIPIALPLSPIGSVGGGWDSEEEAGVIYLTVEDVVDEESGEAMLRLVEIPH